MGGEQRHDLFKRPLLEAPTPAPAFVPDAISGRRLGKTMVDSVPRRVPVQEPLTILHSASRISHVNGRSSTNDFFGASSKRNLPSFTPGFLGGRSTRRRIQ